MRNVQLQTKFPRHYTLFSQYFYILDFPPSRRRHLLRTTKPLFLQQTLFVTNQGKKTEMDNLKTHILTSDYRRMDRWVD